MAFISDEQIVKVLRQYNPWWRDQDAVRLRSKTQKRFAYYESLNMTAHETIRRFVVLSGTRRVGKTTIMYQIMEELLSRGVPARNILYVSFDNPILKLVTVQEVVDIYESLYPLAGDRYFFFDEIQYTENWERWMKVLYDVHTDVRLMATGSASPVLDKGSAESGAGRWTVLKVPTMSFYEYCELLGLQDRPDVSGVAGLTELADMPRGEFMNLALSFDGLLRHFNRYLTIGGFPELVLSDDDAYAQRMLREDVVDKVIKRDVLSLFSVRNPLSMEKLFLYLCMNSSDIFSSTTAANALENISVATVEEYLSFLVKSNLIYCSPPINVGSIGSLKGRPKVYIADAAIRNAVLMMDDVIADDREMGVMVETSVYKHINSFYQGSSARVGYFRKAKDNQKEVDVVIELPRAKILCEVKYRNKTVLSKNDAIVELSNSADENIKNSFVITKKLTDCGISGLDAKTRILRIPALPFLYLLGAEEAKKRGGKM